MKKSMRGASASVMACSALFASNLQAQQASVLQLDRVEITGSSFKRAATEGSLPVQRFSQEDIQRSGAASVSEFLQHLPVMQNFTAVSDSVGGSNSGYASVSIHDLGEQYTLVLINGRRVAPTTSSGISDISAIPLSAVERVEVLTDGASAVYGADAIAGVVNIILKKGATPFMLDAGMGRPQHPGGKSERMSLSKGAGDLAVDGYAIFGSVSLDRNAAVKAIDRPFSRTGIFSFKDQYGRQLNFFNGSVISAPANVEVRYNDPMLGPSSAFFSPYNQANGACPAGQVDGFGTCYYDYASTVDALPAQERTSLYTTAEFKLGDTGFKAFGDFIYSDSHIRARIAPGSALFDVPTSGPGSAYFNTYVAPYLTADQRNNLTSVTGYYRLADAGNRSYDYVTRLTHAVAGVEGRVGPWELNTALTFSQQEQLQNYTGGFTFAAPFNNALANNQFDPFAYPPGATPPTQSALLAGAQFQGTYNFFDLRMVGLEAKASRELFDMSGGAATLGMGVDARRISYVQSANPSVANGELLGEDPQAEFSLSRRTAGAFTELLLPVTKEFEFNGSARFDAISGVRDSRNNQGFGKMKTAGTFKLGGRFQPMKNLLLRGSVGTGFRSAGLQEIAQPTIDFGVTGGAYNCPFTSSYDPLGYIAAGYVCNNGVQQEVVQSGNPELKPERSTQWTMGLVFEPARDLTLSTDLWHVEIRNAVQSVSEEQIFADPQRYLNLFTTKFVTSTGLTNVAVRDTPINIGRRQSMGLDWDAVWRTPAPWGRFIGRIGGTHLLRSRYTTPGNVDQWESSLGKFGLNGAVSFRDIFSASATADTGAWAHTLTANYRSGYKDVAYTAAECLVDDGLACADVQLEVPSYTTFDWQTRWTATKNFSLVFGVNNLADRAPPLSLRLSGSHQVGYDPRYTNTLGRTFYLNASLKF